MPIFGGKKDKRSKAVATIEEIINDADASLKAGDTDKAASEYRRAHRYLYREENIANFPEEFSELFTRTGHGLFETGEPDRAVECFDKATQLNPKNIDAWMSRGIVHLKTGGMLNYAVMCFDEVLKQDPKNEEALENKMEALISSEKQDEAEAILEKLIKIAPDNESYKKRREELAPATLESLTSRLKKNPKDPNLWRKRAQLLEEEGRTAEAIESLLRLGYLEKTPDAYEKVLEYRPDDLVLLTKKASVLETEGMTEEAVAIYQKLVELDPENETYKIKLAELGPDEMQTVEDTLAKDPNNVEALEKKASILEGRGEGAMDVFKKLLGISPNEPRYLEGLLKYKPEDTILLNRLGDLYFEKEDYGKALEFFSKVVEHMPKDTDALHNKGAVQFKLEQYDKALGTFNELLSLDSNDVTAYLTKGAALYRMDKFDESIEALNNVVKREPDNTAAWYYKACAEARKGNMKLVIPFLTRATELDEEFRDRAKTDPAFESVRDSPEFQALINK
jgi:tetratricopeptide (TPR) repeat protein